jgi:hypothetical protein
MGNKPKNLSSEVAQSLRPAQRTNSITRCFIAMRKSGLTFSARRASGVILPMIAALLLLATAPKGGWAQTCPTGYNGPYFITETVDGNCQMTIGYCVNCTTGALYIESIQPDNGGCGSSFDWLEEHAISAILSDQHVYTTAFNPDGTPATPCPGFLGTIPLCGQGTNTVVTLTVNICWQYGDEDPSASGYLYYICPGNSYCMATYTICQNPGAPPYTYTFTSPSWTSYGTPPGCPPEPILPATWEHNTCYATNICGW